ncbi:MAG: DNA-protecting protein DprA [Actinobacteria bacterium]|nr:DNA-protecting protein DprA [Actinomycetota bacterium]MCL6104084.1 DNA-protecting protein DprA [Actinomycetota bacterium]
MTLLTTELVEPSPAQSSPESISTSTSMARQVSRSAYSPSEPLLSVGLPQSAYAASIAHLPGITPQRLKALMDKDTPSQIWAYLNPNKTKQESEQEVFRIWSRYLSLGIKLHILSECNYIPYLKEDPQLPAILFGKGSFADLSFLQKPKVAVVGTRSATHYGREVASELASNLTSKGIVVISGLAKGINAAAHGGALSTPNSSAPILGVAGSGLDVIYPSANAQLWKDVAKNGAIISEAPLGAAPEKWRFPLCNRIIAALSQAVVVVESGISGGSFHTVEAAIQRGIPVLAVPGSIKSPASAGTNSLLSQGAIPLCDVDDVLTAMGLGEAANSMEIRIS